MDTNNVASKLLYPELSYTLTGILFSVHNELGSYARERQYGDAIERELKRIKLPYQRECAIGDSGNIVDFLIDQKIILELKSKRILLKSDYYQTQRYLQETGMRLGILVNFRSKYIKPTRIVRIDTENKTKYSH